MQVPLPKHAISKVLSEFIQLIHAPFQREVAGQVFSNAK